MHRKLEPKLLTVLRNESVQLRVRDLPGHEAVKLLRRYPVVGVAFEVVRQTGQIDSGRRSLPESNVALVRG